MNDDQKEVYVNIVFPEQRIITSNKKAKVAT